MTAVAPSIFGGRRVTRIPNFSLYQRTLASTSATESPRNAPLVANAGSDVAGAWAIAPADIVKHNSIPIQLIVPPAQGVVTLSLSSVSRARITRATQFTVSLLCSLALPMPAQQPRADVIFTNGRVLTVDAG